jgi:hypothetical protein
MPRTKITRHDIITECPSTNPLGLSARYIPYCSGSVPGVDDVEEALDYILGYAHALALVRWNEIPTGTMDGSNLLFTTSFNYVSGTLRVYWNGLRVRSGVDYNEGPGTDEFTMVYAPTAQDNLFTDYKR